MDDFNALKAAIGELELQEGALARNRLVWTVLRKHMDEPTRRLADELSKALIKEQDLNGVYQPSCGELMAAEILFQVWLSQKGDDDGTD